MIAEQPESGRSVAGRHVLGSSPESLEPMKPASLPLLSPLHQPPAEPGHTIYLAEWEKARRRAARLAPARRALFTRTLDHIETGWENVRELQRFWEEHREYALTHSDRYADLLHFIHGDLVDVFRAVAAEVALLVPGYPTWADTADADDVLGETDVFRRYLTVFVLAVEQEPRADPLREVTRAAAKGLAGWCTELGILVASIARACEL